MGLCVCFNHRHAHEAFKGGVSCWGDVAGVMEKEGVEERCVGAVTIGNKDWIYMVEERQCHCAGVVYVGRNFP